jgi:hypothetical protein
MNHYSVFAALHYETKEGWVWMPPTTGHTADNIRITNKTHSVVCERRLADGNFHRLYKAETGNDLPTDEKFIVMSAWYRQRLGLPDTQLEFALEIVDTERWKEKYVLTFLDHPSAVVRTSIWLGLISLLLGAVGALEGVASLLLAYSRH